MAPQICVRWVKNEYQLDMEEGATVASLKSKLEQETKVQAKRQKLLGLKTKEGKPAGDNDKIADLQIKAGAKIMMMGSPESVIEQAEREQEAAPEIQDDFAMSAEEEQALELKDRPEIQEKLERRIRSVKITTLTPPREGKFCLVLDIDYTLFDLGSSAERPEELARPHLHQFLASCYEYYDIVIWSATSMKWVDVKMKQLGVLGAEAYKLVCLMDCASMVTVPGGRKGTFDCKPLAVLWANFPNHYNSSNTIMVDDLRQNFVLNKQNGLIIRPYRHAHLTRTTDDELVFLKHYLVSIAKRYTSFEQLDHRQWERWLRRNPPW